MTSKIVSQILPSHDILSRILLAKHRSSRLLSLRLEFEQNSSNSKNCSSNFEELRSYAENSACETPS
ncbi:hypothetical protein, partial [Staphylococcus felis]|uniref:hypothetical protein n=1 Tax=Staphylococcus felis TaxID=46127 RepID=UPI001EE93F09